jgi:hypothetical protein
MARGTPAFRERDVTRALRAAKKAGVDAEIIIDLQHKVMRIIPLSASDAGNGTRATDKNDFDEICDGNDQAETRQ